MTKTILYADGGCSGNDQPDLSKRKMVAVVSDEHGTVLIEKHEHGGSNNIAELIAVKKTWRGIAGRVRPPQTNFASASRLPVQRTAVQ